MPDKLMTLGTALLLGMLPFNSAADSLENAAIYEISIPADNHRVANVTATLTPAGQEFYMFPGAQQLPARWATFVSNLEAQDEDGRAVQSQHAMMVPGSCRACRKVG